MVTWMRTGGRGSGGFGLGGAGGAVTAAPPQAERTRMGRNRFIMSIRLAAAGRDLAPAHPRQRAMSRLSRPPLVSSDEHVVLGRGAPRFGLGGAGRVAGEVASGL